MQTILGPFHPDLENALVDKILKYKADDPFCPLLILLPSDSLRRHLKTVLGRRRRLSLLNVHLLTFYQLSLRLQAESNGMPLELRSDLFLEEVLRQIIRTRQPGAEPFAGIEERAGGCAALWQTLRDLRDGLVDPAVALDALSEGHFSQRASERTSQLLVLLRTFQQFCRRQKITDQSDLNRYATEQVPASRFLKQFSQIFYFGFYDLTQIQVDFFHAVARHYPTTLYFPYLSAKPSHDAWRFAERFYERYVQGHNTESAQELESQGVLPASARLFDDTKERKYDDFPKPWQCQIVSTFGIHDEVAAAAKEILRLAEDGKLQFHEIGVVARSLESYSQIVKDIFHQHRIPLAGTLEEPLVQFPLTKAIILFLNLPAKDFVRSQVIDLLSSPYFQFQNTVDGSRPHPDLWDLASRELAICKGVAEWRRLRRYNRQDLELRQISDDDEPRMIRIPSEQLACLADNVESLAADLLQLPAHASWQDYISAWKDLLKKYLGIVPDADLTAPGARSEPVEAILNVLDQLAGLDSVDNRVALSDFSHTFQHWLERSSVTDDRRNRDGVMVLSATAARGLAFRALFVLGMNEGVFPRTIREDAFLRDRDREVLERDLGYKVSQKLAAFDEEKLLFTLLVGAARERLYCSFQRANDSGRGLAPSWYVDELKRTLKDNGREYETISIPRSMTEKTATPPFDRQDLLLPSELAIRLTLEAQDPSALLDACAPLPALYRQGRKVAAEIDQSGDRLLPYDGAIAKFDGYWKHFSERGPSPTALETYARCPFQFFARHVLGLEPLDRPEEILGPNPAEFGKLGHEILNSFYRALIDGGYFAGKAATVDVETLQTVAARAFVDYEENNPVGYPLTWESLKDSLVQLLRQVIAQDLSELSQSGFAPVSLETDVTGRLPADWPEPLNGLAIRGRMDRIDRNDARLRVIDYKFKFGANPATQDTNLIRSALRGERLQPPFYILLAQRWAEQQTKATSQPTIEANFYYIAPRWAEGPLVSTSYGSDGLADKIGTATKQTIAYLADGVRKGHFFINRGEYCGHCDMAPICRKNHPPSLWRAENDPMTQTHRALREKDPKKL
ncbi:MAG TPA: PD-(D/E)XK nuclease family protein [Candidatus Binatia bacterium]|jgi:ATP-dependent helicase/nuclease subunit B|nr:PD-(D/E)XK nuclease family protein [Candidatus Binatia bacterium]